MKKIIAILLCLTFLLSGCSLFSSNGSAATLKSAKVLVAEPLNSLDPYSVVAIDRQYLHPIYERLVDFDDQLKIQPQLAYTFGKVDETTWQFKIRSNVKFHDGTDLTLDHIKQTFDTIQKTRSPHLVDLIENIKRIETNAPETVTFKLNEPDPEFFRKLTQVPIISTTNLAALAEAPNGTGPYQFVSKTSNQVNYKAFAKHWNNPPLIPNISYQSVFDKDARFETAKSSTDVVAVLPFSVDLSEQLADSNFTLRSQPDLTVSFFIWNPANSFWSSAQNRQKLLQVWPYEQMEELTSGQGTPAAQFVSSGVLGYNPSIVPQLKNFEERKALTTELGLNGQLIRFAVPPTLSLFGLDLEHELNALGLNAEAYLVEQDQIFDSYMVEDVQLLFLGWRSDLGTGTNFLNTIFKSLKYNVSQYHNSEVDKLLANLNTTYEEQARLTILQELMSIISFKDPYGIPLFYGRFHYITRNGYKVPVRLDSIVLVEAISK